jgi:hydrolase, P-loop family
MTKIYSESEEQTELFAQKIAGKLMPGAILILNGEMGSGKSVFARGIIHGLGYSGTVTSPTFTLMNAYEGGLLPVYHFDLYRLNTPEQLYDIGYDEFLYGSGISLIEWAQRMENLYPEQHIAISIEKTGIFTRTITVQDGSGWMLKKDRS